MKGPVFRGEQGRFSSLGEKQSHRDLRSAPELSVHLRTFVVHRLVSVLAAVGVPIHGAATRVAALGLAHHGVVSSFQGWAHQHSGKLSRATENLVPKSVFGQPAVWGIQAAH